MKAFNNFGEHLLAYKGHCEHEHDSINSTCFQAAEPVL